MTSNGMIYVYQYTLVPSVINNCVRIKYKNPDRWLVPTRSSNRLPEFNFGDSCGDERNMALTYSASNRNTKDTNLTKPRPKIVDGIRYVALLNVHGLKFRTFD
ncbi:hypothetical protein PHYBLDRAFT_167997 [Phycomyces blakesleeanus NRRL 1555(-)]|uniref:Uncharacterized protein n=1 Tax=Phycomyces blakesleeanus (strain ATCC 8743b / DSM 1359 / FGSC 10004 / NBRC 33097 / NRRL 1555) TaxID=763407 RepID=A0A167MZH1_PHYB8|nr:hypothetical protein PHYBLDRAFT_167997 [Phycomyces blakesleeanus NRRL 1555(-)]OAD74594.1 hypothetical protein PHYBLDRAFT_167997 [Phycomyces blakesleeanus NRRL 1555(-)]|eukprot:XP_018292634.1 hypothetical protein PHYBLDRAFT_167997 [Phycomyces blakesleeanus NRRL 1555(-)]